MKYNEFRNLIDAIEKKYFLSRQELADSLEISTIILSECYNGVRKLNDSLINKLKEIYLIGKDDLQDIIKTKEEERKLYKSINRLSKLNHEHKKEVFRLIDSYYKEENDILSKKLTNNANKD